MPLIKASNSMGFSPGLLHSCQYQPHKGVFIKLKAALLERVGLALKALRHPRHSSHRLQSC